MKFKLSFLLLAAALSMGTQCKKNKFGSGELPPLTTTGAGTFGCLVNGKVFLPRKEGLNSAQQCVYQRIYAGDHGYVFLLKGNNEDGCVTRSISVYLDSIKLTANTTYKLTVEEPGSNSGKYSFGDCSNYERYTTDDQNTGLLTITNLDEQKNIVSGTFSFNITAPDGTKYAITDGRFDQSFNR